MADTERLQSMLDNIIKDKGEEAQIDFHSYFVPKSKEVLHPELDDDEKNNEE